MIFRAVLTTSQMGTPSRRDTAASPPKSQAKIVSNSDEVGGLGVVDAGGRSILTLIVVSGAQIRKIITRTASASPPNLNQPDFVIRRPNNFVYPLKFRRQKNPRVTHSQDSCRSFRMRPGLPSDEAAIEDPPGINHGWISGRG